MIVFAMAFVAASFPRFSNKWKLKSTANLLFAMPFLNITNTMRTMFHSFLATTCDCGLGLELELELASISMVLGSVVVLVSEILLFDSLWCRESG